MAQGADGTRLRSLSRQWASDRSGRGSTPPQTRTGSREAGARYIKKSPKHLFARPVMNYQFIVEHRHEYPITIMCRVLVLASAVIWSCRNLAQPVEKVCGPFFSFC